MKRALILVVLCSVLFSLSGVHLAWGKAHVPLGLVQVCNAHGRAKNVTPDRSNDLLERGNGCRLPTCAFNLTDDDGNVIQQTIFPPNSRCDNTDKDGDGFCDASGTPGDVSPNRDARGVTQACSPSF